MNKQKGVSVGFPKKSNLFAFLENIIGLSLLFPKSDDATTQKKKLHGVKFHLQKS